MTRPLHMAKQSVDLAGGAVRVSRIRRDPPPVVKKVANRDPDKSEAQTVVIGILTFELALFIIVLGFGNYMG